MADRSLPFFMRYLIARCFEVDRKYDKQLYNCSLRSGGYMYSQLSSRRDCKRSKMVICFDDDRIIGWGIRFKHGIQKAVMLYVSKTYRRKGIGTEIYRKLTRGVAKKNIKVYRDYANRKFFGRLFQSVS